MSDFRTRIENELASALNRVSAENGSNTPDFILATYLADSLEAFDKATKARERWYNYKLSINYKGPLDEEPAEVGH